MLKGIDVSHYQNDRGPIDWRKLADQGYTFAMIKLTEGQSYIDPEHAKNIAGAKAAGLSVGGYHFARFQTALAAKEEADHFRSVAIHFDLDYVILDIEHPEAAGNLTYEASVFMDAISDLGQPLLYSYPAWIRSHFSEEITKYPLWIAHYGVKEPDIHPWTEWQVWQHSSTAKVDGVKGDVDVNYMQESFAVVKHVDAPKTKVEASHITVDTDTYTIESGDTFWDLENKWGLHHGTLQHLNPKVDPSKLQVGQKIYVPAAVRPAHHDETVHSGDTLSEIAAAHGTTVAELMRLNPQIKDPDKIFVGEKIHLPGGAHTYGHSPYKKFYVVRSGDVLLRIADRFNTTVAHIVDLNPNIKDPDVIRAGEKIRIK